MIRENTAKLVSFSAYPILVWLTFALIGKGLLESKLAITDVPETLPQTEVAWANSTMP